MALYHKWDVKNYFTFVLQFFSIISDGLRGVRRLGRGCAKGTFDFFSWSYLQVSSFYLPTKVNFLDLKV